MEDKNLELFRAEYNSERARLDGENADEREIAINTEKHALDVEHTYEKLKLHAIAERRRTLSFASSISMLLYVNNIRPEIEHTVEEPIYETKGLFRKREVQVDTRKQIALEGWPLEFEDQSDSRLRALLEGSRFVDGKITLTTDQNTNNHPSLVWHRDWQLPNKKDDVKPLPHTPLSYKDITWYLPPVQQDKELVQVEKGDLFGSISDALAKLVPPSKFIDAEVLPEHIEELTRLHAQPGYNPGIQEGIYQGRLLSQKPDYETYERAQIEQKIRKAIAQIAARYKLLD